MNPAAGWLRTADEDESSLSTRSPSGRGSLPPPSGHAPVRCGTFHCRVAGCKAFLPTLSSFDPLRLGVAPAIFLDPLELGEGREDQTCQELASVVLREFAGFAAVVVAAAIAYPHLLGLEPARERFNNCQLRKTQINDFSRDVSYTGRYTFFIFSPGFRNPNTIH